MATDLPLLSICVPTYNRSGLLSAALKNIVPQIMESGGAAELIVSDNASTDDTAEIVRAAGMTGPVRYHRNAANLGACRNIRVLTNELARGRFGWLLGDDELLRPGAVNAILQIIRNNADIDFIYVNYSIDDFERREGKQASADQFENWSRTGNPNVKERRLERWELLLPEDLNCLTAMYSGVFKLAGGWTDCMAGLDFSEPFRDVQNTYPHTYIHGRVFVGKPVISTGYPWVIMCGKESWAEHVPVAVLLRFHELLDYLVDCGVDPKFIDGHRREMLRNSTASLSLILQHKTPARLDQFSIPRFALKYRRYREMWHSLRNAIVTAEREQKGESSALLHLSAAASRALSSMSLRLRGSTKSTL